MVVACALLAGPASAAGNRTFTDQVAGLGSNMRHALGRKKMMTAVTTIFEGLRRRAR